MLCQVSLTERKSESMTDLLWTDELTGVGARDTWQKLRNYPNSRYSKYSRYTRNLRFSMYSWLLEIVKFDWNCEISLKLWNLSAFDKKSSQSQFSHYFTFGELLEILRLLRHDHRQVLSTLAFIFFLQQITLTLKEKFWQKHIFSLNCQWLSESAGRRTGFYCWDCDSHASYFYWPAHGWYVNFYSIKLAIFVSLDRMWPGGCLIIIKNFWFFESRCFAKMGRGKLSLGTPAAWAPTWYQRNKEIIFCVIWRGKFNLLGCVMAAVSDFMCEARLGALAHICIFMLPAVLTINIQWAPLTNADAEDFVPAATHPPTC